MEGSTRIAKAGKGKYSEKRSKFLAFAMPIGSADKAMEVVNDYKREYHDARHVCFAYALGTDGAEYRVNDNGEPSGTAGRPIMAAIKSRGLTDVLVIVVRYYGGTPLGTPGLIRSYRAAAAEALDNALGK